MIQTNHSAAVSWAAVGPSSTASVPPVLAVAPAAAVAGDRQGSLGQGTGQEPQRRAAPAEAAPDTPTPAEAAARSAEARARREARAEAQRETVERLRETLRRVWDASGAVVEQALAREAEAARAAEAAGNPPARRLDAYNEPADPSGTPGSRLSQRA